VITIFHGDDLAKSRHLYLETLKSFDPTQLLHLNSKSINLDQINNFINGGSLFAESKVIAIDNFFSITKSTQTKLIELLSESDFNVILWQDKLLTVTQLKTFPKAVVQRFKTDNNIFMCINSLKPHNLSRFITLYQRICSEELFDLFFFLLKASIRRQLLTKSVYSENILVKTYLQMIELEYQYKTGQLSLSKETALERVLLPLLR
jgi:hypothetical protein